MSKRIREVITTDESTALKGLRVNSKVSLRKLAELMGPPKTRIHQMETGRDSPSKEYIVFF